jgi:predicted Zn finger-like uncharacterized protein
MIALENSSMPIDAQCGSCSTRYKIVDTAAGRRVKCRKCGNPFYVPGDPVIREPVVNLAPLAELEKTAIPAQTEQSALIQYKAAVSLIAAPPAAVKRRGGSRQKLGEGTSIHDLAPHGKFTEAAGAKKGGGTSSFGGSLLLLGALACGGLLAGAYYLPSMSPVTYAIFLFGGIAAILGGIVWGVIVAFLDDSTQGLLSLMPPYFWYYASTRWEERKAPVLLQVGGAVLIGLSFGARALSMSGPAATDPREKLWHHDSTAAMSSDDRLVANRADLLRHVAQFLGGPDDHLEHLGLLVGSFARLQRGDAQAQRAPLPA